MSQQTKIPGSKRALLTAAVFALASPVASHSWVEQVNRIAQNGTMIDPVGYQRAFVGRGDPGFKGSIADNEWLIPPNGRAGGAVVETTDNICNPRQTIGAYSAKYPMLTTAPGDFIALRHEENGHVTMPQTQANKPKNRGTVYVYGTAKPTNNDTLLAIHNVWTADGTGGDKRGRLLATRNYDDGQCFQINGGEISTDRSTTANKAAENPQGKDLWCQADLQLPTDLVAGTTYTLYWVWDWPTLSQSNSMPGDSGVKVTMPEIYTSCIDLKIVDPCSADLGSVKSLSCSSNSTVSKVSGIANSFSKGQDLNNAAILDQLDDGNFAVAIPSTGGSTGGSTDGSTGGAAASSSGSGQASGVASASTTLLTVTTPAATASVATKTVTVTEGVATVYVTATPSANGNAAASPTENVAQPQTPGVQPSVTPISSKGKAKRGSRKGRRRIIGDLGGGRGGGRGGQMT